MEKSVSLGSVRGIITPPSSKSYAQRAIALSLLAEGRSVLRNIEFCKDTRSALACIEALGAKVTSMADLILRTELSMSESLAWLHVSLPPLHHSAKHLSAFRAREHSLTDLCI